jgi:hypothetical protein
MYKRRPMGNVKEEKNSEISNPEIENSSIVCSCFVALLGPEHSST